MKDIAAWIAVAGGGIELHAEPRFPINSAQCVSRDRADRPRHDRVVANAAGLAHNFDVAIEIVSLGVEPHINDVSVLGPADG